MVKNRILICSCVLIMIFLSGNIFADEIWFKNGDHITGKIIRLEGNKLTFKTMYAGEINLDWQEIDRLRTENPVKAVLTSGSSILGQISPGDGNKVQLSPVGIEEKLTLDLTDIKFINPEPSGPPLKTKARVNLGANFTSGNTDTKNLHFDGELVSRTDKNRFTIGGRYGREESNNTKTADNVFTYIKYDQFITKKLYFYANATGEKDAFKDLDLRSSLGLGAGYQFIETDLTNLSLEGGISYVNEDFIIAEDIGYKAARWGFNYDHYLYKKALQFFHNNTGLQSLEDSSDFILYSQTGLRVPLFKHMDATAQYNHDYNKSPAPGKVKSDKAYIISIGYQWGD